MNQSQHGLSTTPHILFVSMSHLPGSIELLSLCRYTLFIPLYPIGMIAEMAIMIQALPYLKAQKLNSIGLPNALNFGFDYHLFIKVCCACWAVRSCLLDH